MNIDTILRSVPAGSLRSYKWLAGRLGHGSPLSAGRRISRETLDRYETPAEEGDRSVRPIFVREPARARLARWSTRLGSGWGLAPASLPSQRCQCPCERPGYQDHSRFGQAGPLSSGILPELT